MVMVHPQGWLLSSQLLQHLYKQSARISLHAHNTMRLMQCLLCLLCHGCGPQCSIRERGAHYKRWYGCSGTKKLQVRQSYSTDQDVRAPYEGYGHSCGNLNN